ncbi:MAG: AAA family ATPase [Flavobacteriales bacterium]|nr:AAA family ATPase [Flavobacteriales bacterium]
MTSAQEYIAQLAKAFQLEKQEEMRQFEELLKGSSIAQRKKEGVTWFPLRLTDTGFGMSFKPVVTLKRNPGDAGPAKFQVGDSVSIFEEAVEQTATGVVQDIDAFEIRIILHQDEVPDWEDERRLGVNLLFDLRTFEQGEYALQQVLNAEKGRLYHLRECAQGNINAGVNPNHMVELPHLNTSQNTAVNHILSSENIAVVHGPPGTGKTTTIAAAISQLVKKEGRVLACAPSNAAIDHLAFKLIESGLNVVRIGNVPKIHAKVLESTLDMQIRDHKDFPEIKNYKKRAEEFRKMAYQYKRNFGKAEREQRSALFKEASNLRQEARKLEDYIVKDTLAQAQVVVCTLVGANHFHLKDQEFKTAVIDEAGQALEPLCWIPALKAEKIVLSGDPLQLPPTVKSMEAEKAGLSKTLLERVNVLPGIPTLLDTQYRMHNAIMHYSNHHFYDGKLQAHESVATRLIREDELPVEFVDTAGCGFMEKIGEASLSRYNPEEAQLLGRHLEQSNYPPAASIGVITPYREQLRELQELLQSNQVEVNTVDSFQGQEKDIVYISLVRSNENGEIGFLKDYRRMNVALTRARMKLVVIGDSATIGQDSFYSAFIDYCEQNGYYRSAWEFMYS